MITNNPEHKKAALKKLVQTGKIALSVSLAGTVATITVFVYSNMIKKQFVSFRDDLLNQHSIDSTITEIVNDKIENTYKEQIIEEYNKSLTETSKQQSHNDSKQNIDLVYDPIKTDFDTVELNDHHRNCILRALNRSDDIENPDIKVTVSDLKQVRSLDDYNSVYINDDSDISWLNYCTNLDSLEVQLTSEKATEKLKQIKRLQNLSRFTISSGLYDYQGKAIDINEENFSFLKNSQDVLHLSVESRLVSINSDYLQELINQKKVTRLKLDKFDATTQKINADKLKNFTSVDIVPTYGSGVYDIAAVFSRDDFEKLFNSDFDLTIKIPYDIDTEQYFSEVRKTYDQVESIMNSLDIKNNMNNKEKMNVVLEYVLNNLSYGQNNILSASKEDNTDVSYDSSISAWALENSYKDGYLYGAFNENGKPVCGNYAALMNLLLKRAGVESFLTVSPNHAYNLVNVDGEYYYIDATYLDSGDPIDMDEIINSNYQISPAVQNGMHDTLITPSGVDIPKLDVEKRVDQVINNVKKQYLIKFNNQIYNVSFTALMSILAGLGLAVSKKKLEKLEKSGALDSIDNLENTDSLINDFEMAKTEYDKSNSFKRAYLEIFEQANLMDMQGEFNDEKGINR